MTMYGSEHFRTAEEYSEMTDDGLLQTIDEDAKAASVVLHEEHPEVDGGAMMEEWARAAFGGDLRDADAWREAARSGELAEAWEEAAERVMVD